MAGRTALTESERQELERLREFHRHAGIVHALLDEWLTIEGLIEHWPEFVHAREAGRPYRPVTGRTREGGP